MIDRTQWLEQRRKGIGGSDAAAVLGLSKWRTPLDVYLEKRGEGITYEPNDAMHWGTLLEPVIRQEYADRTGNLVREYGTEIVWHPKVPFLFATVDGVTDSGRLLEIKTARASDEWGEPGTDEIPQVYLIQVQHYLACVQLPVADVAVLIGGQDFRLYEVEEDLELQDMIVESEIEFWGRVKSGNPPDPVCLADVVKRYGRASSGGQVQVDYEIAEHIVQLQALKTMRQALEESEERHKMAVLAALGEADTLLDGDKTLATWKLCKAAKRFDTTGFRAAYPELYDEFAKVGEPYRRFLLKE